MSLNNKNGVSNTKEKGVLVCEFYYSQTINAYKVQWDYRRISDGELFLGTAHSVFEAGLKAEKQSGEKALSIKGPQR